MACYERPDVVIAQYQFEVGGVERALVRLVEHHLARRGIQFRDDVVAVLAAHQQPSHAAFVADADLAATARQLARRAVGKVGAMAFAGMDDHHAVPPCRFQHPLERRDAGSQHRHVIAQCFSESAGFNEVTLHVDDDQRR